MTRETKIGLLVGLGFIIVIGILLSDHIQSATEPPRAQLGTTGFTARQAIETPGAGANASAPTDSAAPVTPIATSAELRNAPNPQTVIRISPANDDLSNLKITRANDGAAPGLLAPENALTTQTPAPANSNDGAATSTASAVKGLFNDYPTNPEAVVPTNVVALARPAKTYVAVKGDTVSRMAAKFYGDRSPAMQKLITEANKDLKANPANVIIGHTYTIQANPKGDAAPAVNPPAVASTENGTTTAPAKVATVLYSVKAGDTLWKIAREQVGSVSAVAQIQELNRDVLKGSTNLKEKMTLKLPAKAVATAD